MAGLAISCSRAPVISEDLKRDIKICFYDGRPAGLRDFLLSRGWPEEEALFGLAEFWYNDLDLAQRFTFYDFLAGLGFAISAEEAARFVTSDMAERARHFPKMVFAS